MSHRVLAIGAGVITVAGYSWYVPALVDLRAGDDRPRSTRLAALATATWWLGTAVTAVLLLVSVPWQFPTALALAAALVGAVLRLASVIEHRAERREEARRWAIISRPRAQPAGRRLSAPRVVAWTAFGLAASSGIGVSALLAAVRASLGQALMAGTGVAVAAALLSSLIGLCRVRSRRSTGGG